MRFAVHASQAMIAAVTACSSPPFHPEVSGRLTHELSPIEGALLRLSTGRGCDEALSEATTDADGEFVISGSGSRPTSSWGFGDRLYGYDLCMRRDDSWLVVWSYGGVGVPLPSIYFQCDVTAEPCH